MRQQLGIHTKNQNHSNSVYSSFVNPYLGNNNKLTLSNSQRLNTQPENSISNILENQKIQILIEENDKLKVIIEDLESKRQQGQIELQQILSRVNDLTNEMDRLETIIQGQYNRITELESYKQANLNNSSIDLKQEIEFKDTQLIALNTKIEELNIQISILLESNNTLQQTNLQQTVDTLQQQINVLLLANNSLKSENNQLYTEIQSLNSTVIQEISFQQNFKQIEQENEELKKLVQEYQIEIKSYYLNQSQVQTEKHKQIQENFQLKTTNNLQRDEIEILQINLRSAEFKINELESKFSAYKEMQNELNNHIDRFKEHRVCQKCQTQINQEDHLPLAQSPQEYSVDGYQQKIIDINGQVQKLLDKIYKTSN